MFSNLFCKSDPILTLLNDHLGASALKIPDGRIQTLGLMEGVGRSTGKYRGVLDELSTLAVPKARLEHLIELHPVANISQTHTQATDAKIGLQVLAGFLRGFGVELPSLNATFADATKVTFSFNNVQRRSVSEIWLGKIMKEDFRIDVENPAISDAFRMGRNPLLLITSTIVSNNFSMHVTEANKDDFTLNITALEEELGNLNASLSATVHNQKSVTFQGADALPFAFSTVQLVFDRNGKVLRMPPHTRQITRMFNRPPQSSVEREVSFVDRTLVDIEF